MKSRKDSWCWPMDRSKTFSVRSLFSDLMDISNSSSKNLYSVIWKDAYPKKIKLFLWELSHGRINTADRLQWRMPYLALFPSCGSLCYSSFENPCHLFVQCSYASQYWLIMMEAFDWPLILPNNIFGILDFVLMGHLLLV